MAIMAPPDQLSSTPPGEGAAHEAHEAYHTVQVAKAVGGTMLNGKANGNTYDSVTISEQGVTVRGAGVQPAVNDRMGRGNGFGEIHTSAYTEAQARYRDAAPEAQNGTSHSDLAMSAMDFAARDREFIHTRGNRNNLIPRVGRIAYSQPAPEANQPADDQK